jgi:hypothetical protein
MENRSKEDKPPPDVKVHIRKMYNDIILTGRPGERKENGQKICRKSSSVLR